MELSKKEIAMGVIIVVCTCCDNVYKAHQLMNSLTYSSIPNYGCAKCQGIPTENPQQLSGG